LNAEAIEEAASDVNPIGLSPSRAIPEWWSGRHERGCLFIALRDHFVHEDRALADWRSWPVPFRDADSPAVAEFARESWSNPRAVASGARVGAPPDLYNPARQDWGVPPLHPLGLHAEGYHTFIELLGANMRHCGSLARPITKTAARQS
jgi:4-alpha-glucanotransferase